MKYLHVLLFGEYSVSLDDTWHIFMRPLGDFLHCLGNRNFRSLSIALQVWVTCLLADEGCVFFRWQDESATYGEGLTQQPVTLRHSFKSSPRLVQG